MNIRRFLSLHRWSVTLLALLLLVPLAAIAAPVSAQGVPGCPIRITMYDALYLHALPSYGSAGTGWLTAGDIGCLFGRSGNAAWVQLALPNQIATPLGWAPASAFTTTVPITVLPVTDSTAPVPPPVTPPTTTQTYVVRAGDTLYTIAQRYGVVWTALAQANNLVSPYVIYVGQVLAIPGTTATTPPPGYGQYVVKQGDYLVSIARQYNLSWWTLATVNAIQYPYVIYPGQVLLIPASS